MSPRAAWRLEQHGFRQVYDYVPGKMDWLSFGLPRQGSGLLAGDVVRRDVPTCGLHERVGEVRPRAAEMGLCVALGEHRVVMGLLREEALARQDDATVDAAMRFGPTTVRPSESLDALTARMGDRGVDAVLVTSSDGRLMGLLVREDAERLLARPAGVRPEVPPSPS